MDIGVLEQEPCSVLPSSRLHGYENSIPWAKSVGRNTGVVSLLSRELAKFSLILATLAKKVLSVHFVGY